MVHGDVRVVAEAEGELAGKGGVELDAVQAAATGGERGGDGAVAGADFNDGAGAVVADRGGDAQAGCLVHQKILA